MLEGLKVIECGHFIAAPFCAKLLADLGAEVLKVEAPGQGDRSRDHGPFRGDLPHPEGSGLFLYLNANKRGITLNLGSAEGRQILDDLLRGADVLIEDHPPQQAEALGLSYATLAESHPRLIVTSLTPFGQTGPWRDRQAYDLNACAISGISWAIGQPDREPLSLPLSQGEYQAGLNAAAATLAALLARKRTGRGQQVDISQTDLLAFYAAVNSLLFTPHALRWHRAGRRAFGSGGRYPYTILPCKDGYVCLIARARPEWERFLQAIGSPSWADDPRYQNRYRMGKEYPDEVDALLLPWLKEHTKEEIFAFCRRHQIPFAPVREIAEVMEDPQLKARGFWEEIDHPEAGRFRSPGLPYAMAPPPTSRRPAPRLGEHNAEVYGQLGVSPETQARWKREGIV
ncbi:MAG: CoA transferase [Candidatus Tectomicrobia bacterium]|uniref:CoA transferase n=1 Tax=Tectimicrobiota bacterium TaxID=2528274 RepID=A0A932CP14_UNCTE|nr:CoA transferase [Candidatus Tectomicrobia bacterium]